MPEYANEEYGVPVERDGVLQDPDNHNGNRVARALEEAVPETPETSRGRYGRKAASKPETR